MDRGLFVLTNSDIDEEELKSFIAQKRSKLKKLSKRRNLDSMRKDPRRKNSSLSPSSVSSSPPDSDAASVCSVSSTCSTLQMKLERKRKKQVNKSIESKKLKTDSVTVDSASPNNTNRLPNSSSWKNVDRDTPGLPLPVPNAWRNVNSEHYIFSCDEDSHISKTESNFREREFCRSQNFHSVGRRNSHLWHNSDWMGWKECNTYKNCGPTQAGNRSLSCLTDCNSCAVYSVPMISEQDNKEMSYYLALDCEFVGVGPKKTSALGRCSIVDHKGEIVFDHFVKPPEEITDYRTPWSGLRPQHIRHGIPLVAAQEKIAAIIKDKVVIGHAVHNDFRVMDVSHPVHLIRDTASCKLLREMANLSGNSCALRKLTSALLGRTIQKREHCSVTDARACLDLFRLVRTKWEPTLQAKLKRQAAWQSEDKVEDLDNVKSVEIVPRLNCFFDDAYWPDHVFKDSC